LPRHINHSIRWYLPSSSRAAVWAGMSVPASSASSPGDLAASARARYVRTARLTHVMLDVNAA
jgi:hypothetical protein